MRFALTPPWPTGLKSARLLLIAAALGAGANAAAAPRLHCHIEQGGTVQDLQFGLVSTPYAVAAVPVTTRFRFKAVMVGEGQHIAYIKLYTYYQTKRQAMLLQETKYLAPQVQAGTDPASLTGIVYVYSPLLGREMVYSCALREEAA